METTGRRFGPYEIVRRIARGGMAEVSLALDESKVHEDRRVVIKRVLPGFASNDEVLTLFADEARLAARLDHPSIVRLLRSGFAEGLPFLVFEHVDGAPLSRLIELSKDGLPLGVALRVLAEVCAGLHHAHELADEEGRSLEVVHRDVSPQNVMVSVSGATKLIDFGVARASTGSHVTGVEDMKGKLAYAAPEQLDGGLLDRRTDVFAAGVVLFEAVTGTRLYRRATEAATAAAVLAEEPPPLEDFGLPVEVDLVVRRALQKDPAKRYRSAEQMGRALEEALETLELDGSRRAVARTLADALARESGEALAGADTVRIDEATAAAAAAEDEPDEVALAATEPPPRPEGPPSLSTEARPGRRAIPVASLVAALLLALAAALLLGPCRPS